jgi:hypothetical protein
MDRDKVIFRFHDASDNTVYKAIKELELYHLYNHQPISVDINCYSGDNILYETTSLTGQLLKEPPVMYLSWLSSKPRTLSCSISLKGTPEVKRV